jgi:exonuclease SbcD
MFKLLHFSDAHIDIVSQGRRDAQSGLPIRVMDFLKALDCIVNSAIEEKVDLVLFSGDAFKDRNPVSIYRREWDQRIMRISQAGIPVILLVGNHDVSASAGRANTLHEFETLQVPRVKVISQRCYLKPEDLWQLPIQIIAIPYLTRSTLLNLKEFKEKSAKSIFSDIEKTLQEEIAAWLQKKDPSLPMILTAHASVEGATYGQERNVILGNDLILSNSLVKNQGFDYVALGHIHKAQDINLGGKPPVVYPGSIERVDFSEAEDDKYFSLVEFNAGQTTYQLRKIPGRRFIDRKVQFEEIPTIPEAGAFMEKILKALPAASEMEEAMVKLAIRYPKEWEILMDESIIRKKAEKAFEFHLVRQPFRSARLRLPANEVLGNQSSLKMAEMYLRFIKTPTKEMEELLALAADIMAGNPPEESGGNSL